MLKRSLQIEDNYEIIIAASAAGIAYTTQLVYGILVPDLILLLTIFLMMWGVYRVNRILDMKEDSLNNPARIKRLNKTKGKFFLWIPPIIAFLLALALAFVTNKLAFLVIVIAFLWIIGYSVKIRGFRRIKEVLILKTAYASVAWGMLVFIATFMLSRNIMISTWSVFLLVLINISINEIMYDIRDINGDKKAGIHTFPVVLGLKKSKQILLALVVIEVLLPIALIYLNYLPLPIIFLSILSGYTYYLIKLLDTKKSSNFLFNVLVGGEQILWPIAYLVILIIIYK